jgi:transcriptional regulator with PAS, ATPase and Fis domain
MGDSDQPANRKAASPRGAPGHFHLLWDDDLEELREILQAILNRRHEVVDHWYQLHVLHFGDARSLSEAEFTRIWEPALERNMSALLQSDMDRYAREVIRLGELLAERGVPIEEVIASLHLFEESAHTVFPHEPPPPTQIYTTFDKLSHVRIILLVSAYFRSHSAVSMGRLAVLERDVAQLPPHSRSRFRGLVGASAVMRKLYDWIEAAAASPGNLLIVGESGTGKELVARAVHDSGARANRPFVAFNCAAIPKDLIESELFGYRRGAFSGANTDSLGLFRAAEGGTLFLDEVTEMSPATQSKLLRAIQERAVRPVGATREQPVDVRLIASTNREPQKAVSQGQLREDLYYRLQASVLRVPPLRSRREDIPALVEHFIAIFNERLGRSVTGIEERALQAMLNYSWPGNVRELCNVVEGALTFGTTGSVGLKDLPVEIGKNRPHRFEEPVERPVASVVPGPVLSFAEAERELIKRALETTGGNKLRAAGLLRISRKKLYAKIKQHKL